MPTAPGILYPGGSPATPDAAAALYAGGSPATPAAAGDLYEGGTPATPGDAGDLYAGGSPATPTAPGQLLAGSTPATPGEARDLYQGGTPATPTAPGTLYPVGGAGGTVMRVTPVLRPDISGMLQRVDGVTLHGQPVWTSNGLLTTTGIEDFIPYPTGVWIILHWIADDSWTLKLYDDGLGGIVVWSAPDGSGPNPVHQPWAATDWQPTGGGTSGVPYIEQAGDDLAIAPGLSDMRLAGDYSEIGTLTDGQAVWTKDGAVYTGANVAAMKFAAGVDEFDDPTYNLSFYTSGTGTGSGFYSTDNSSPPPTGSWTAFGTEYGAIQVSAVSAGGPTAPASIL